MSANIEGKPFATVVSFAASPDRHWIGSQTVQFSEVIFGRSVKVRDEQQSKVFGTTIRIRHQGEPDEMQRVGTWKIDDRPCGTGTVAMPDVVAQRVQGIPKAGRRSGRHGQQGDDSMGRHDYV